MATRQIDYFYVEQKQEGIDRRLENWAVWVAVRRPSWVAPMFKMARSNSRQWHTPEVRAECNTLDAAVLEKAVYALPEAHRAAIRWCYVYKYAEDRYRRQHGGIERDTLMRLIRDGRQMLINRL